MRSPDADHPWPEVLMDVLLRAVLIILLAVFCFRFFHPFLSLMLWSIILAVTLYPLQRLLSRKWSLGNGWTATIIVVAAILILAVPALLLGDSLLTSAVGALKMLEGDKIHIPPPWPSVDDWPVVGPRIHEAWQLAANDPQALLEKLGPRFRQGALKLLGTLAGVASGFLLFIAALPIAGIFMAYGTSGTAAAERVATSLVGPLRGHQFVTLCAATIRAVAQGVIGIAFIQTLLIGPALVLMGVPAAGLLALAVLMLGIVQLPATLITIPVIIYVFATQGASAGTIVFAIYVFIAGLADNVLKPLLLGRGVEVPMPVILIGALGGMITDGLLGLFIGPVVLGVAYELFWKWVDEHVPQPAEAAPVVVVEPVETTPGPTP
ncbi:AI-2E family transporter [Agrilutibacter solisilvae]|uniref:AI-2E family transporter n=1 Tax=Agrilutibacter solisilvae TaxID=2763317 RepID=A0A975ASC2_9GAMM|nr:AI-2E family transporter [Lysobacter solisilvae]QSX78784.1 AI-2E family transporter [Lysobacter solisilvae]